jgi:AcrR family transcriptional regulator
MNEASLKPRLRSRPVKAASKDPDLVRERRGVLIAAAVKVFKEKGFHESTVRDIGRVAGMTQGSIYNYVESKDDILYLVCDRIVSEYLEQTRKALEISADPERRVRSAIRAVCEVMHEHQEEILLIYQDSHLLDGKSRRVILARVEEFVAMFEGILRDAAKDLNVTLRDPHFSANVLTFLPTMIALRRWSLKNRVSHQDLVDQLVDFLYRGLGFEATAYAR